ncbi:phthiocerol/phthiodiolone dimycocerosyl transferase family protein [Streptomyces sp. NPDC054961]
MADYGRTLRTGRGAGTGRGTTSALVRVGRANGVSVHGLVSAAVMIAHAEVKAAADHVHEVAVPFIYPVDARTRISPPVDAFGGTNIFGTVPELPWYCQESAGTCSQPRRLA